MKQLNNILGNDESLREFIDLFVKGLGNAVRIYGFPKLFRMKRSKQTPPKSKRRKTRS